MLFTITNKALESVSYLMWSDHFVSHTLCEFGCASESDVPLFEELEDGVEKHVVLTVLCCVQKLSRRHRVD